MPERLAHLMPAVASPGLRSVVFRDYFDFKDTELYKTAKEIEAAAELVIPKALKLPENNGKTGFTLAITTKETGFPIYTVQFGRINQSDSKYPGGKAEKYAEYASLKAFVHQVHPEFIASSENSTLPIDRRIRSTWGNEIPGGGIAFDDLVIAGSGLPQAEMDEAVVLAIGLGSKVATYGQVNKIASDGRVKCATFYKYEDKLL